MARLTDTEQIRLYLKNHLGGVLDFGYVSKHVFPDISVDNLRKYISRISKEGLLKKVSKGIYLIGESELSDRDRVIEFYTKNYRGIKCGESLLFEHELIDEEPKIAEIITSYTDGNKLIGQLNIQLYETKNDFYLIDIQFIMEAMELINLRDEMPESDKLAYRAVISTLLMKHYSDHVFERCIREIRYPRKVYISLAQYLDLLNISNRVMDIYEDKLRLCVCEK